MSKYISNVVNFQEYKDKKNKQLELDREELLQLIKKIVTNKKMHWNFPNAFFFYKSFNYLEIRK